MNTKEYFYLSDEELMHLIDLSETDGLLPAPKQLKSAILTAAARAPRPLTRAEKRKQFLAYCARVGVACGSRTGTSRRSRSARSSTPRPSRAGHPAARCSTPTGSCSA